MSFMPNIGTQVLLADGRTAWVSQITPDGSDDRVLFSEDNHEEKIDQITDIAKTIGEEAPFGFNYVERNYYLLKKHHDELVELVKFHKLNEFE